MCFELYFGLTRNISLLHINFAMTALWVSLYVYLIRAVDALVSRRTWLRQNYIFKFTCNWSWMIKGDNDNHLGICKIIFSSPSPGGKLNMTCLTNSLVSNLRVEFKFQLITSTFVDRTINRMSQRWYAYPTQILILYTLNNVFYTGWSRF